MKNSLLTMLTTGILGGINQNSVTFVPTIYPSSSWVSGPTTGPIPGTYSIDTVNDIIQYPTDTVPFGNGSWNELAVVNFDVPDGIWLAPNEVITGTAFSNAPDYSGIKEVRVQFAGGPVVTIPGSAYRMGPRGVAGWQFKISAGPGKWGVGQLSLTGIPYQGYPKTITKTVIVDDSSIAPRSTYHVNPNGSDSNDGKTIGLPFKTLMKALGTADNGSIIKMSSGTHDLAAGGVSPKFNSLIHVVTSEDGVAKESVLIDCPNLLEGGLDPVTLKPITIGFSCAKINFDNLTFVLGRIATYRLYALVYNGPSPRRAYWSRCNIITDQSTDKHRIGFAGPIWDDANQVFDVDELSIPGSGGFGSSPINGIVGQPYINDGVLLSFMECIIEAQQMVGDQFRRNVYLKCGADATKIGFSNQGNYSNPDGTPKGDYEDVFMYNVTQNLACPTAFKTRFHDTATVRVKSVDQSFIGSTVVSYINSAGSTVSSTWPAGLVMVTLDCINGIPQFQTRFNSNGDDTCKFITGAMSTIPNGSYGKNSNFYGPRLVAIGDSTTLTQGGGNFSIAGSNTFTLSSNVTTTTINSVKYVKGTIQALIHWDNSNTTNFVANNDIVNFFNAYHTDFVQYTAGAANAGAVSNPTNQTFCNNKNVGPGAGNMFLFQSSTGSSQNQTLDFTPAGGWAQSPAAIQVPVKIAITGNVVMTATPNTVYDGVPMTDGDRVVIKGQSTAADNGIYVYHPTGFVRDTDNMSINNLWSVTSGLTQAGMTAHCTANGSSYSFNLYRPCIGDQIMVANNDPRTQYWFNHATIQTVNPDGLSGTLSRPFTTDGTTLAPALTNVLSTRYKSINNFVYINTIHYCTNIGQFGIGGRNAGFWNCSFFTGSGIGGYTFFAGPGQALEAMVFADCYGHGGFGMPDYNLSPGHQRVEYDPHQNAWVMNLMSLGKGGNIPVRYGGNLVDRSPSTIDVANQPKYNNTYNVTGVSIEYNVIPSSVPRNTMKLTGATQYWGYQNPDGSRKYNPQMIYDMNGDTRLPTSPIGALV